MLKNPLNYFRPNSFWSMCKRLFVNVKFKVIEICLLPLRLAMSMQASDKLIFSSKYRDFFESIQKISEQYLKISYNLHKKKALQRQDQRNIIKIHFYPNQAQAVHAQLLATSHKKRWPSFQVTNVPF